MPFASLVGCCFLFASCATHADLGLWSDIALGKFVEAERTAEANFQADGNASAANLAPLCLARSKLKRYGKLFDCIDKLAAVIAAGDQTISGFLVPTSDVTPMPDLLRAGAYLELNRIPETIALAQRALQLAQANTGSTWGPLPPKGFQLDALTLLGIANALTGNTDAARNNLAQLIALDVADTQAQKYANIQAVYIARVHMALGEYDKALARMQSEHEEWVAGLSNLVLGAGDDSVSTIFELPKLLMLAKAQAATGKSEQALKSLDVLIAHPRIVAQGDVHWLALFERGKIAEQLGNSAAAIEFYRRAIEVFEQQRASLTTEASKIGFVGDKQEVYYRIIRLLIAQQQSERAFDLVERAKARALVDLLASKRDFGDRANSAAVTTTLQQLDEADLASRALTPGEGSETGSTQRAVSSLFIQLQQQQPELASLVSVNTVALSQIRKLLGANETLVEYYVYKDFPLAFVVERNAINAIELSGVDLRRNARRLRRALKRHDAAAFDANAQALHGALIKPIEPFIKGDSLLIVPHGFLHYLPFAALQSANGSRLIDRWSYRVLPSASVMKFLPTKKRAWGGRILAFGNPSIGGENVNLPFAETEARAVAGLVDGSKLLLRDQATESQLKNAGAQFSRIHLATHGDFNAATPLQSGLLMAADNTNDGRLTVSELYGMRLDADLATLSACETGLGQIHSGDDVVGLARGFLYAGVHSIVASLWQVEDRSTALLMEAFYRNLAKYDKRQALRQAQLETRKQFPDPYFWAAFQLTGAD